jgi:hypothetical protein
VIPSVPSIDIRPGLAIGGDAPPLLLAGPCVIESLELCRRLAGSLAEICANLGIGYVFKASFDKANRTSVTSFRGPGLEKGLEILAAIRDELPCQSSPTFTSPTRRLRRPRWWIFSRFPPSCVAKPTCSWRPGKPASA